MEEETRNELQAARLQRFVAEKENIKAEAEKKRAEEKWAEACDEMENLRGKAREAKRQLQELEVCEGT